MQFRKYEVFFIVDPDLGESELKSLENRIKEIVVRDGGQNLSYSSWGKRKLAYPVKKRTRGHYFLMEIAGESKLPHELERNFRIDERVLKFITVKLEDHYNPSEDKDVKEETQPVVGVNSGDYEKSEDKVSDE